ncbi:uncharacterized protein [Diabrotica undecimpunctata]|uniref:uncharacterized protein n=1 Tax=Diabrotica undecimpunctata TaxID=50387 RepID=UPI003B63D594
MAEENPPDRGRIDDVASNMDYEVNEKQKQFEEIINIDINTQSKQVPITNSKNFLPDYQVSNKTNINIGQSIMSEVKNKYSQGDQGPYFVFMQNKEGGDFNCHNKMWGCDVTDQEGLYLFEAMEECGLNFLNDGSETLIRRPMNLNRSAIDLTICSRDIYYKFNWHTETLSLGSDHYPIVIEFNHNTDNNVTNSNDVIETNDISRSRITWDIKKADWAFFTYLLNNEKNNNISDGSEQEYSTFCDSINLASKCSIPERKRGPNAKFNKPWWNDDFVNEWTDIFFNKIARPWVIEGEINHRNPTDNRHENDEANTDNIFLTQAFSLEELKNCLKRHNNSAPGLDGIHYSMLYNLPIHKKVQLLNVINNIWMSMDIPRAWKEYIIVPILKPHKSPNCPDSYRGISLSSCVQWKE